MAATPLLSKNAYLSIGERIYSLYEEKHGEDKTVKKLDSIEILDLYKEKGSKWISSINFVSSERLFFIPLADLAKI